MPLVLDVRVALVPREAAATDLDALLPTFDGAAAGSENAGEAPPDATGPSDRRSDAASRRDTWACEGAPVAAGSMAILWIA
ncbi:MAG: hypothetical protein HYX53_10660 [Chloroflexi bacterium]|nr:hypothetical protein [Chloroflexota bacterium]